MAKTSMRQKAPECPRTAKSSGMDNLPSEAGKALQPPLEAPERASGVEGSTACLKQSPSKPLPRGLDPVRDTETARERGRAGGLASAASRRKRKEMRAYLETALRMTDEKTGESNAMAVAVALVDRAKGGDVRAWEAILAAVGERPAQLVDVRSGDGSMTPGRDLTALPFDQLMELARAEWGQCADSTPAVDVEAQP